VIVFAGERSNATCISSPSFTSVSGSGGTGVNPALGPNQIALAGVHFTARDGHPYTLIEGHAGKDVSSTRWCATGRGSRRARRTAGSQRGGLDPIAPPLPSSARRRA
jgi:hypothetical protein